VVDSKGELSEQIDVVMFDRQYSPLIFHIEDQEIIPAESVYAVFEARQTIKRSPYRICTKKVESVRRLYRTSLPILMPVVPMPPRPCRQFLADCLPSRANGARHWDSSTMLQTSIEDNFSPIQPQQDRTCIPLPLMDNQT